MSEKKVRTPKKLTVSEITRQFDLLSLPDKLAVFQHARTGIEDEKKKLEDSLQLIGGKG